MHLINENTMYSAGNATMFLYLASITFFLFGICMPEFFVSGMILTALFFAAASIILGIMVKQRIGS